MNFIFNKTTNKRLSTLSRFSHVTDCLSDSMDRYLLRRISSRRLVLEYAIKELVDISPRSLANKFLMQLSESSPDKRLVLFFDLMEL